MARRKTREWRTRRAIERQIEAMQDIPAQIRRYRIKDGGELEPSLFDEKLISYRNPKGSKYVANLIRIIDEGDIEED